MKSNDDLLDQIQNLNTVLVALDAKMQANLQDLLDSSNKCIDIIDTINQKVSDLNRNSIGKLMNEAASAGAHLVEAKEAFAKCSMEKNPALKLKLEARVKQAQQEKDKIQAALNTAKQQSGTK